MKVKGFTVVELLIALSLFLFVVGLMISSINFQDRTASKIASKLMSDFSSIEMSFNNYLADKNSYPVDTDGDGELLDESALVPVYLYPPKAPEGFSTLLGVNGYSLSSNASGYYVCALAPAVVSTDPKYIGMKTVQAKAPASKVFLDTTCGATTNIADPTTATDVYITYWIVRF